MNTAMLYKNKMHSVETKSQHGILRAWLTHRTGLSSIGSKGGNELENKAQQVKKYFNTDI